MTFDAVLGALQDIFVWAVLTVGSGIAYLVRQTRKNQRAISELEDETDIQNDPTRLESHEQRMERQQQNISELKEYFVGDPDDPSNPGLLSEIHDIKKGLEKKDD